MTTLKARRITPTAVQVVEAPIRLPEKLYQIEPRPRMIFRHVHVGDGDIDIYDATGPVAYTTPVVACVRDSQVAGKGLYTCRDLAPGDVIGRYTGEIVGWRGDPVVEKRDSRCLIDITVFTSRDMGTRWQCVVDGSRPVQPYADQRRALRLTYDRSACLFDEREWPGVHAHMINDAEGAVRRGANNCRIEEDGWVFATAHVPGCDATAARPDPRSELLWAYGADYWRI